MARRNDHSREEIREMALRAAENILDREGAAGLSTRKISGEIGYTVGSLYLVFQNLDDLIAQVNTRTLNQLAHYLDQVAARGEDTRGRLIELGRAYLRFAALHRGRWEQIFDHHRTSGAVLPGEYRQQVLALFERVENLLAAIDPNRPASDRALAARSLWSGVHGVCTLALGEKLDIADIADADKLTDSLIVNYLAGWSRD